MHTCVVLCAQTSLVVLSERLSAEKSLRAALQVRMTGHQSMSVEAAKKRGREAAARLIQMTYRHWRTRVMKKRMEKEREVGGG